jgi:DNA-binding transcriptional LysR family regulator
VDNLFAMDALVRAVERGGFAPAARELGVTPSALSKVVSKLERRLGVRLLHRSTRKLKPTAEGEAYLARAVKILEAVAEADNEAIRHAGQPSGRLRMHAGTSFGTYALVPALPDFLDRYPAIELDLRMGDRPNDPAEVGADLIIRLGPPPDAALVARPIADIRRVICASPAYIARHGAPADPAALAQHQCLTIADAPDLARWPFREGERRFDIEVRGRVTANSAETLVELALLGQGIVRLPDLIVGPSLAAGRLVRLLADRHVDAPVTVHAIHPYARVRPPKVAAMVDFLVERFGSAPWRSAGAPPGPMPRAPRPRVRPRRSGAD